MLRREMKEYRIWGAMKTRCTNPNTKAYKNYGGRGIAVCERWAKSFDAFLSDMGPIPGPQFSIERVENDRGYEPGNCIWATRLKQNQNARSNRRITIRGVTKVLEEWARTLGVAHAGLQRLLAKGWDPERVFDYFASGKHRQPRSKSGFRCVFWYAAGKKWKAQKVVGDKSHHLGYFQTPEEAYAEVRRWEEAREWMKERGQR